MNNLKNQENLPEIRMLHKILRNIPIKEKQDHEWQLLENTLFAQIDSENRAYRTKGKLFSWSIAPILPETFPALATIAAVIILLCLGTFYMGNLFYPKKLIYSRVLGIKGDVTYIKNEQENIKQSLSDNYEKIQKQNMPFIFKGQVLETSEDATLIIQLDKKSSFMLTGNTKLSVKNANSEKMEFYLHKGNMLAMVSKRKKGQTFIVKTPDALCKVIGTIFNITVSGENSNESTTNLSVLEGKVSICDIDNPKVHEIVNPGQTISLQNNVLSKPYAASENQTPIHLISTLKLALEMSNDSTLSRGLLDIISTPPGAKIFIKDKLIGLTPMVINQPVGIYDLKLMLPEYDTWQETISLEYLKASFIHAFLQKSNTSERKAPNIKKALNNKPVITPPSESFVSEKPQQESVITSIQQVKQIDRDKEDQTDNDRILHPSYVEALLQMSIGEYQKALIILDSIKELPEIDITERIRIMGKISACYKGLGNFENTLKTLNKKYKAETDKIKKGNLLWEIITVKVNCLEDYSGGEQDILTYLSSYQKGAWREEAYAKLAEIQYITGKHSKAVGTYQYHINFFKTSNAVEKSIYTLANIMRMDIKDYLTAIKWYSKLLKEYPSSIYYSDALFERAECYQKQKQYKKARRDYKKYLKLYPEGRLKNMCFARLSDSESK